jgi:hypothetical protein
MYVCFVYIFAALVGTYFPVVLFLVSFPGSGMFCFGGSFSVPGINMLCYSFVSIIVFLVYLLCVLLSFYLSGAVVCCGC